jgi:phosphoserine aminotransferase
VDRGRRVFNFSAGPACLPTEVMRRAAAEFEDWGGTGMGFVELSHRDALGPVQTTLQDAALRLRRLLAVPPEFRVLFLQGGAHAQARSPPSLCGLRLTLTLSLSNCRCR